MDSLPKITYAITQEPTLKVEVTHNAWVNTETKETNYVHIVNKICGILDPIIINKQRYEELIKKEKEYDATKLTS